MSAHLLLIIPGHGDTAPWLQLLHVWTGGIMAVTLQELPNVPNVSRLQGAKQ